jgi:hypothetical protein
MRSIFFLLSTKSFNFWTIDKVTNEKSTLEVVVENGLAFAVSLMVTLVEMTKSWYLFSFPFLCVYLIMFWIFLSNLNSSKIATCSEGVFDIVNCCKSM